MLVALGGLSGSGRKFLAQKLAEKYGFHYYDIGQKKARTGFFDAGNTFREQVFGPRNDKERTQMYERVVVDFPMLSKMYPNTVCESTFHRSVPRDYFFEEARKYFRPVIFVWIDSDGADAEARITGMAERAAISSLAEGLHRRDEAKKEFQPFSETVPTFHNVLSDTEAPEKLSALIQTLA